MAKIDELRMAASEYGQASIEHMLLCRDIGRAILAGFDDYLGGRKGLVIGVPAEGELNLQSGDYRDAAFSFHDAPFITLEDIDFGVFVRIDNLRDEGACWARLPVRLSVEGEQVKVFIGDRSSIVIPREFTGHLGPIFEALYEDFLGIFRNELEKTQGSGVAVGFQPPKKQS